MVSVEVPGTATLVVLNIAVTPAGADTVRDTNVSQPLTGAKGIVELATRPREVVTELGEAEIVKSGARTVTVKLVACVSVPLMPVTVTE